MSLHFPSLIFSRLERSFAPVWDIPDILIQTEVVMQTESLFPSSKEGLTSWF